MTMLPRHSTEFQQQFEVLYLLHVFKSTHYRYCASDLTLKYRHIKNFNMVNKLDIKIKSEEKGQRRVLKLITEHRQISPGIKPCSHHANWTGNIILNTCILLGTFPNWNLQTQCGVVVSGVRRMNIVKPRSARLVLGWVTVFWAGIPSQCVTSQLGQLSLASLQGRLIEYQLRLG